MQSKFNIVAFEYLIGRATMAGLMHVYLATSEAIGSVSQPVKQIQCGYEVSFIPTGIKDTS